MFKILCTINFLVCRHDQDCPQHAQFCDFGRCECRSGFVHSEIHSGFCERALAGKFKINKKF